MNLLTDVSQKRKPNPITTRKSNGHLLLLPAIKGNQQERENARRLSLALSRLFVSLSLMATSTLSRWLRPEVYPLFLAVGTAVGICGMQLIRNISMNPEVRVTKENRTAGILENFDEGEKYAQHSLRKFVRNKSPEIMPSLNKFFSDPQ